MTYYSNVDTNMTIYGLTIIILLFIVIACVGCLFTAIAGGSYGYQMGKKATIDDSVQLNKEYQRIDV